MVKAMNVCCKANYKSSALIAIHQFQDNILTSEEFFKILPFPHKLVVKSCLMTLHMFFLLFDQHMLSVFGQLQAYVLKINEGCQASFMKLMFGMRKSVTLEKGTQSPHN